MVSTSLMVDTITVPSRRCLLCAGNLALTQEQPPLRAGSSQTSHQVPLAGKVSPVDQLDAKRRWVVGRYRTWTEATSAVAKVALQEDDL